MVKPISYISYGENEKKIIKAGIVEIRKVLMGNDKNKKRSLLFALDWLWTLTLNKIFQIFTMNWLSFCKQW